VGVGFKWCIYVCICGCVDVFIYMCMFACVPIIKKKISYISGRVGETQEEVKGERTEMKEIQYSCIKFSKFKKQKPAVKNHIFYLGQYI